MFSFDNVAKKSLPFLFTVSVCYGLVGVRIPNSDGGWSHYNHTLTTTTTTHSPTPPPVRWTTRRSETTVTSIRRRLWTGVDGQELPTFLTPGATFRIEKRGTAVLPCSIRNLGHMVQLWKNGTRVISVGKIKIKQDMRISLQDTGLVIKDVTVWDTGSYSCEIEIDEEEPLKISHFLQVLDPPWLEGESVKNVSSLAGSAISLACRAAGQPAPNITWTRGGRRSEYLGYGNELILTNLGREDGGEYTCVADNGVGSPATQVTNIQVLYSPEILPAKKVIHADIGHRLTISCEVWSNPTASLHWVADPSPSQTTSQKLTDSGSVVHSLHIVINSEVNFGSYTCVALNSYGQNNQTIIVRGNPDTPEIVSDVLADTGRAYTVRWRAQYSQNVQEYKLLYRQLPDEYGVYAWDIVTHTPANTSREVEICQLEGLVTDTAYVLKIQGRNEYGWSQLSPDFTFYTRGRESSPKESLIRETDRASFNMSSNTIIILCIVCIVCIGVVFN